MKGMEWYERALQHYQELRQMAANVPVLVDEDPSYEPQPPMRVPGAIANVETFTVSQRTYDQTDALLSELLRVLHLLRGDVVQMNETMRKMREEPRTQAPQVVAFPSRALRNGSPI